MGGTKTNQDKKQPHSKHQTQWAAQFAVASELCKRDYQVALTTRTLGSHCQNKNYRRPVSRASAPTVGRRRCSNGLMFFGLQDKFLTCQFVYSTELTLRIER